MNLLSLLIIVSLTINVLLISIPLNRRNYAGSYVAYGGYSVFILLGTPPQRLEVYIDTGSAQLAINCIDGKIRGRFNFPQFDYKKSSTFQNVTCESGGAFCDDCAIFPLGQNSCLLNVYLLDVLYQDGGWIKGNIISDVVFLPGVSKSVRANVGCSSHQSRYIVNDPTVNGIWGIGRGGRNKEGQISRLDQLITALSASSNGQRMVSLCLAAQGGFMNLGTVDSSLHTQPGISIPYDDPLSDAVSKSLSTISFGTSVLTSNGGSEMPNLIIDSGSTTSVLNLIVYRQVVTQLKNICENSGKCRNSYKSAGFCFSLSDSSLFSHFPPIIFTFKGSPVYWYAEQYLSSNDKTQYCTVFSGNDAGHYLLGDDFMLNKDIVFGESSITIYQQSKCSGKLVSYQYDPSKKNYSPPSYVYDDSGLSTNSWIYLAVGLTLSILTIGILSCLCYKQYQSGQPPRNTGYW